MMTCEQFDAIFRHVLPHKTTFVMRERMRQHLRDCPHCEERVAAWVHANADPVAVAIGIAYREADARKRAKGG